MEQAAQPPAQAYDEPPELEEQIQRAGSRIFASATIMFFLAFVFAYFYLHSLNNAGDWRPHGVDPPTGWGIVIFGCYALSAALFAYGSWAATQGRAWTAAVGVSLVLGLVGCAAQGIEYDHLSFGPRSGGYGSVFVCWTALYAVFVLLTMYRVETILAAGLRHRNEPGYAPVGFSSGAYYWTLLGAIGVLTWVILYLI